MCHECRQVCLDALVRLGRGEGGILFQHWYDRLHGVVVARELVASLRAVHALPRYLRLPLPDELVAHAVKHWHHYLVEQMVPLNVEIRGLRCHAESS